MIKFINYKYKIFLAFGGSTNQEVLKPLPSEQKEESATGFVDEKDFRGGFAGFDSNGFGAVGGQDYFEQAQRQAQKAQESEEEEGANSKPGPSYISHRVPAKKLSYESEVETLKQKPSKLKYSSPASKNSGADEIDEPINEQVEDKLNLNDFKPAAPLNIAQFQPNNPNSKILEEAVGTLNNLAYNPEYYKKLVNAPHVTPYQKYSFQPAASTYGIADPSVLNILQSTAVPFNPSYAKIAAPTNVNYEYQPSEVVSENLKGKDCVRISKEVSNREGKFNKQPMSCYVCKDEKSGAKSEHCSYSNEPNPKSYYKSTSYKSPDGAYRNKRDESESYSDPYEEIKAKSHEYYSKPEEFSKDYYKTPDLSKISEPYSYSNNFNDKEAEDKSYSEIQSEQLLKKGENCKKSTKNGVTCTVCTDAKTGANFEQCSYESAPNEKKYAYVKESKYDGEGNPIEEKETGSTVPQPVVKEALRRSDSAEDTEDKAEETRVDEHRDDKESEEDSHSYDVPASHFSDSAFKLKNIPVRGLDPALYGSADDSSEKQEEEKENEPEKFGNFDDYHLKLFPQFANQESKREETKTKPDGEYFAELSGKKDVEKVLEEFTKKDRSNCKQVQKKGMTCYLCVDQKGIQQEECMYVSESRPQSSHIAYHEVQHLKSPKITSPIVAESKLIPETEAITSESQKKSKTIKEATSAIEDNEANASTNYETRIKFTPEVAASDKVYIKNKRDAERRKTKAEDETQDPKPQFDVEDEGGLYAAETEPVYSKALGLTLPRYMLEKSPFEQEFDKSVAAH